MTLKTTFDAQSINQLLLMHREGQINLNPGFQRKSVWTLSDRRKLIQSIVAGMPLPNVFLYHQSTADGRLKYDVIDGKQRLETIFAFTRAPGFGRGGFDVKLDLGHGLLSYDWAAICRKHPDVRAAFERYKLQTVEITGLLGEIIDVFISINSTGKRLTSGEKRHAKFYTSRFLHTADALVRKHRRWILDQRVNQRLLGAAFRVGMLLERSNPTLPPIRSKMWLNARSHGVPRLHALFYVFPMAFNLCAAIYGLTQSPRPYFWWLLIAVLAAGATLLGPFSQWLVGSLRLPSDEESRAIERTVVDWERTRQGYEDLDQT